MSPSREPVAQTNLQLYAQLRRAGRPADEIEAIGRAYALAMTLLAGQYRANGKPQVDHFVGTASVAAAAGGRPVLVRAALLHNAYGTGVWKDGRFRATPRRRRELRSVIGAEAEELVCAYEQFPWSDEAVRRLLDHPDDLVGRERDLTLLRLANEVDDRTDLGLLHSRQVRRELPPMIELAERIGATALSDELRQVADEEATADVEPGLRNAAHGAVVLAPLSHRRRWPLVVTAGYQGSRKLGGRVLRRLGLR